MAMIKEDDCPACEEGNEGWIFTYADMITLLFCFFVILYSMCQVSSEKMNTLAESMAIMSSYNPSILEGRDSAVEELASEMEQSELATDSRITVEDRGVVVSFNLKTLFEPDSIELNEKAKQELLQFATVVYLLPNKIEVNAHTDDSPSSQWSSSWELSGARAAQVARYLVQGGVDGKKIVAKGFGSFRPQVPNASPQQRRFNNRVEILLLPEEEQ